MTICLAEPLNLAEVLDYDDGRTYEDIFYKDCPSPITQEYCYMKLEERDIAMEA